MALTTATNPEVIAAEYLSRKILDRVEPNLQVHKLGMQANIPKGESKLIRWVRYDAVAAITTPLTEGTTPAATAIPTSDVSATAVQYGAHAQITDVLNDVSAFDNLNQAGKILGDTARKTMETLAITELDSAGFEALANGAASEAALIASDTVELDDFIAAMQLQRIDNLDPHSNDQHVVVLNKAVVYDLLTDSTGVSWYDSMKQTQQGQDKIIKGELGSLFGMRFYDSGLMSSVNNGTIDVKYSYIMAYEPFGTVDIKNQGIKTFITPGGATKSDPLDQRRHVGYKFYNVNKYLEAGSKRVIVLKSA